MPTDQPWNVYREQLWSLYRGVALWEPEPVNHLYEKVEVGDVGYLHNGFFYRMFNVKLPWDDPLNQKMSTNKPENYKAMDPNLFVIHPTRFMKGDCCSPSVVGYENTEYRQARESRDAEGFTYECKGPGALLSLPHDGHRESLTRVKAFEKYIRDNIDSWFTWSKQQDLPVERMGDLILVTERTLVTSWAAAAFIGRSETQKFSLVPSPQGSSGQSFEFRNVRGDVAPNCSHFDSVNQSDTPNQCIFIKGFRAERIIFGMKRIRAAAEPLPDDPDDNREDEIQVTQVQDAPQYRDPLLGILDYITKKCPEDVVAITHDDDLQIIEDTEALTVHAVEQFLHENQIPVLFEDGVASLHVQDGDVTPVLDDPRANISATAELRGEQAPSSSSFKPSTTVEARLLSKLLSSKMRRRDEYEPSLMSVETTRTAPPPYETSSLFHGNAPVPPQYLDIALALGSPQPSVLASSSSHNEELRASSSQRVENVTTPTAQPEIERSKHQPREFKFSAPRRVPSSYSSAPTNRGVDNLRDVYRKRLARLYRRIALWERRPVEALSGKSVDVPSHQEPPRPRRKFGTSNDTSVNTSTHPLSLQNQDDRQGVASLKRRALLIGITYTGPHNKWSQLDGPHGDVDRYRDLLTTTYGYRPEDIVVLKDQPELPARYQPTRVNMIRELNALVAGAALGDRLTFLFSGHSDQQEAKSDDGGEGELDEMLIASDEQPIIDNELREIFDPLPAGCSLLAILDTCHSGTLLDLPHYHCNNVYVPWQSKGAHRSRSLQNANTRHWAMDFENVTLIPKSIEGQSEGQWFLDEPSNEPPQIDTQLGERRSVDQREDSPSRMSRESPRGRELARTISEPRPRCLSPVSVFICDGWCEYSDSQYANIICLSACSDLQRAWECPSGSLTSVLCNYLKNNKYPSYGTLMSHINFQLHDNALALHEYTRHQKRKAHRGQGEGFDGELDNFQEPKLSSLVRLNMEHTLKL